MSTQSSQNATIESVFRPVLSSLARLARQVHDGRDTSSDVNELRVLLETLPLSSEQFALACNRLRNAHRYLQAQEARSWSEAIIRFPDVGRRVPDYNVC